MKNRKLKGIILALSFLLIFFCEISWSIDITVTGSWSETIDASDLVPPGAGSNLIDTYQSDLAAVQLNITATGNWKVQVKKTDSTLPGSLHLHIRKTPAGSYQDVTDTDQDFLGVSGTGNTNVNVQFELTGVSIQVPPGVYSATIQYTVFDQ